MSMSYMYSLVRVLNKEATRSNPTPFHICITNLASRNLIFETMKNDIALMFAAAWLSTKYRYLMNHIQEHLRMKIFNLKKIEN